MSHEEHLRELEKDEQLKRRGADAMGFDQDKTVHHFLLRQTGGAIEVTSKDSSDAESIAQIRAHVRDIAESFGNGQFDKPFAVHGEPPPGADVMAINKERIRFRYEERPKGAAVVIETSDATALKAVHDFLRYQITEHKTGDALQPAASGGERRDNSQGDTSDSMTVDYARLQPTYPSARTIHSQAELTISANP